MVLASLIACSFISCASKIDEISIKDAKVILEPGEEYTLTVEVKPEGKKENCTFEWSSSSPNIADVIDGVVYAFADGSATISVKVSDKVAKCIVEVETPTTYDELNAN